MHSANFLASQTMHAVDAGRHGMHPLLTEEKDRGERANPMG